MSPGKGIHMNLHVHSYVSMVTMLLIELRCVWQVCYLWNGFVDMTSHATCFGNRQDSIGGPLHAIGGGRHFRHVRSFVIAFFSSDTSPNCIWKWCFVGNFRKRILYFCKGMIFLGSNGELCEVTITWMRWLHPSVLLNHSNSTCFVYFQNVHDGQWFWYVFCYNCY